MSRAKPTLGYASRTDAVMALRRQGLTAREIAGRIGISVPCAAALLSSGTRRRAPGFYLHLRRENLYVLKTAAIARRTTADELAARILAAVIEDGLVEAVLDDGGGDA